jgi:type IV secretion system protein VirB6
MKVNGYCSLMSKRHSIIRHALKIDNKLYNDYVFDQFQFEGIVGDLTSYGETLKIMYKHGAFIESGAFGGYEVEVTRKGCPHMDGDGLQYAIVKRKNGTYQPWDSSIKWSDAKPYIINTTATNKKLPINKSGKLYFRIDPSKIEGSRADTLGGYGIIVNKSNDKKKNGVSGTISTIVNKVTSFFIGEGGNNPNDGKVQNIFFKLVATPNFIKGVRALLMLYIIYTGISYMIGIAKTTQHEAIIRILKIAIVIMLISPNAWVFFNTYLFRVFLLGGMELTYDVVQPFTTITKINVENTNYHDLVRSVFSMYDTIYYQLFNSTIWIKIWALICTSLVGGLLALLIIIAIVIYTITTIRMVTIYLMSVITLSILFLVSPIFISFLLFEKTAKLFRSWINNMISMVFQPVFGFTAIAILYTIFLYTLYAALSFTACPTCLLSFDIFDWKLCLPANGVWWVVLYGAHFPMGSVGSVVDLIPAIIAVLILAQSMDGMVQFATNIANKIATNSFYGFGLDGVSKSTQGHVVSVISRATDVVLGVKEEAPNSNIKDGAKEGEKKRD